MCLLGIALAYRLFAKRNGPLVRAIVFHDVVDKEWFETTIQCITRKYNVITPDQFVRREFDARRINVLVTFDDGYASWLSVCDPVLKASNIKALFFINSGLLDACADKVRVEAFMKGRLLISPRTALSWEGARKLIRLGHTLGGHTVSHPRLSGLPEHSQRQEVVEDKQKLEQEIQKPVTLFAYPFGNKTDYTKTTEKIVKDAGYINAFTTEPSFAVPGEFEMPRMCIEDGLSERALIRWIEGGYDLYRIAKNVCVR
jgi:peptidoglycan/xylan/chitin deacetylase (PgdA/CDA1 family)